MERGSHYEFITAKRDAGLACVRSDRARAAILGVPYRLPPAKETRITVCARTGIRTIESIDNSAAVVTAPLLADAPPVPATPSEPPRPQQPNPFDRPKPTKVVSPADYRAAINLIIRGVEHGFYLQPGDLLLRRKTYRISRARFFAIYLVREALDFSLMQLSRIFNHMDHTAVMHALRRVPQLEAADPSFAVCVERAREACGMKQEAT